MLLLYLSHTRMKAACTNVIKTILHLQLKNLHLVIFNKACKLCTKNLFLHFLSYEIQDGVLYFK